MWMAATSDRRYMAENENAENARKKKKSRERGLIEPNVQPTNQPTEVWEMKTKPGLGIQK